MSITSEEIPAREKERVQIYMSGEMQKRLKRVISYQHLKKGRSMDISPYLMTELVVPHIESIEKKMRGDQV